MDVPILILNVNAIDKIISDDTTWTSDKFPIHGSNCINYQH